MANFTDKKQWIAPAKTFPNSVNFKGLLTNDKNLCKNKTVWLIRQRNTLNLKLKINF